MGSMLSRGNAPLLFLITSAMAACSSSTTTSDLGDAGTHADASADANANASADANADANANADADANETADADVAFDASPYPDGGCPPGYYQPDPDGGCVMTPPSIRRPFLVGASMRSSVATRRRDWSRDAEAIELHAETARLLAASWLKDALEEHASIAAFARFTMQLLSVGAPMDLVEAAQRASLDEIRHAELCFTQAHRLGAPRQGPSPLRVHDALGPASLVEIAALCAEEGCVGETLGAALAREQLAVATDAATASMLRKIARDEARHAELAWKFVRFAVLRGGDDVRRVVEARVHAAIAATLAMEIRSYDGIDLDALHAYGKLTCAESRAVAARAIDEVVLPSLRAALAA
jgi:hypothetical protein